MHSHGNAFAYECIPMRVHSHASAFERWEMGKVGKWEGGKSTCECIPIAFECIRMRMHSHANAFACECIRMRLECIRMCFSHLPTFPTFPISHLSNAFACECTRMGMHSHANAFACECIRKVGNWERWENGKVGKSHANAFQSHSNAFA